MTRTSSSPTHRQVDLERIGELSYRVTNARGGTITIGEGQNTDFTPVELLLTALAGCNAVTIEAITMKRAEPVEFSMVAEGHKISDDSGSRLEDLQVTFTVQFADDEAGATALERIPRAMQQSHDRFCTVSRTVRLGTDTALVLNEQPDS